MLIDVHVLHKETIGVVPGQEHVLQHLAHTLLAKLQVLTADHRRVNQVKTKGVRTVAVDHLHRIRIVLLALRHLVAVGGKDQAVRDQVAERRFLKQCR